MKLQTVYFDAYRSLIDIKLDFSHDCLALVGINESGKSNVLRGIAVLSSDRELSRNDIPKMDRRRDPYIRFDFELEDQDFEDLSSILDERLRVKIVTKDLSVSYHVRFDRTTREEKRFFTLAGLSVPPGTLVLRQDALTNDVDILLGDELVPLSTAIAVSNEDLAVNEENIKSSQLLWETREEAADVEAQVTKTTNEIQSLKESLAEFLDETAEPIPEATPTSQTAGDEATDEYKDEESEEEVQEALKEREAKLTRLNSTLKKLETKRSKLEEATAGNELYGDLQDTLADIDTQAEVLETVSEKLKEMEEEPESVSERDLNGSKRKKAAAVAKLEELKAKRDSLQQPLREKYTDDQAGLEERVGELVESTLASLLPPVVKWQYSQQYILEGETEFQKIREAKSLDDVPRPLLNVFRIGLRIRTIEELFETLEEIETDSSERSRLADRLNRRIDDYLKSVWKDYDQEISIALEQSRIRIQFFDPNCKDASYYEMQERSQGCQTFVSFLLTIGAEAKKGVIRNTVLLLDEPETHLHPSGVRFMLDELKEAANAGNKVVFATHSVFMIDQSDYDRHIIVRKTRERTQLLPSKRSRIGFFMQEEVLYAALDVDLTRDLTNRRHHNFVFEGHGDAVLFDCFYRAGLKGSKKRPFEMTKTSFYHGGKCSDIKKYFSQKPIQLGTTWVFIIDSDQPANQLRDFLESKYKSFIGTYIHIFQFTRADLKDGVELEDMIPSDFIQDVWDDVSASLPEIKLAAADGASRFSDRLELALSTTTDDQKSLFKAKFKEVLNLKIEEQTQKIDDEKSFKEGFPEFFQWASETVESISEATNALTKPNSSKRSSKKSPANTSPEKSS